MCPKLRFDDGMLARKIIEEKFTLNNMVQKLNSVYLKILNSANSYMICDIGADFWTGKRLF